MYSLSIKHIIAPKVLRVIVKLLCSVRVKLLHPLLKTSLFPCQLFLCRLSPFFCLLQTLTAEQGELRNYAGPA